MLESGSIPECNADRGLFMRSFRDLEKTIGAANGHEFTRIRKPQTSSSLTGRVSGRLLCRAAITLKGGVLGDSPRIGPAIELASLFPHPPIQIRGYSRESIGVVQQVSYPELGMVLKEQIHRD